MARVIPSASGHGNHVLIARSNGWLTLHAHLSAFTVRDGDVVERGDPIGLVGSMGFSTGPHLHFEIRRATSCSTCAFLDAEWGVCRAHYPRGLISAVATDVLLRG